MDWRNITLILVAGLNIGLAFLIWLRNPKNKINITFSLAVLSFGLWSFGEAMFRGSLTQQSAAIWARVENIFGSFIVVFFFIFSLYFPYQQKKLGIISKILIAITTVTFYYIVLSPFYITDVILNPPANDFIIALYGRVYFSVFLTFYLLLSFYLLSKKYFYSQGVFRKSTITVIIATGFAGVFSTFFGVIVPLFFGHNNPWFAACFSLPMIFILAYFVLFGDKKVYIK